MESVKVFEPIETDSMAASAGAERARLMLEEAGEGEVDVVRLAKSLGVSVFTADNLVTRADGFVLVTPLRSELTVDEELEAGLKRQVAAYGLGLVVHHAYHGPRLEEWGMELYPLIGSSTASVYARAFAHEVLARKR